VAKLFVAGAVRLGRARGKAFMPRAFFVSERAPAATGITHCIRAGLADIGS
jgi:hypothetical protein